MRSGLARWPCAKWAIYPPWLIHDKQHCSTHFPWDLWPCVRRNHVQRASTRKPLRSLSGIHGRIACLPFISPSRGSIARNTRCAGIGTVPCCRRTRTGRRIRLCCCRGQGTTTGRQAIPGASHGVRGSAQADVRSIQCHHVLEKHALWARRRFHVEFYMPELFFKHAVKNPCRGR